MFRSRVYGFVMGIVLILGFTFPVQADGIIVPELPPECSGGECVDPILPRPISQLVIRYHHVNVKIAGQIAEVSVDQEFYNPNDWTIEGFYVFPLPTNAAVSKFILWVNGEPVRGEVLDAEAARQIYEESVRELKDPALLEYFGHGAIKASVFPIPPEGTQRIELRYEQILESENGLVGFRYPLSTEKFSLLPLEEVKITAHVQTEQPLRAVYCLSHDAQIEMDGKTEARVSYTEEDVLPDKDFELFYSVGEGEGVHLLSQLEKDDPGEVEGYFALFIAPSPMEKVEPIAKDVLFVLDRSGSMEGEKFQQAQTALISILRHLNPEDRFYLAAFNDAIQSYANEVMPVGFVDEAVRWVEQLSAGGSTDINRALLEAVSVTRLERPTYLIFLTDGLPTEGETDTQKILRNFSQWAPDSLRTFVFGVGYDVDTYLLDSLAEENHGISMYVKPEESLEEIVSSFYNKISSPVLTDISLDFTNVTVFDIYPPVLPDLFSGSQLIVLGRYKGGGKSSISLSGMVGERFQEIVFENQVFADGKTDALSGPENISRLWATRKIGFLLKEIRLKGVNQELIDQVIQLSIRYGIVTPYTSFLVTEPELLDAEGQVKLSEEAYEKFEAVSNLPAHGLDAFERAAEEGRLAGASVAAPLPEDLEDRLKVAGDRAFLLTDEVWTDTSYDPARMKTREIVYLSTEYFELAETSPAIAAWLAIGKSVLFVKDGVGYKVVDGKVSVWQDLAAVAVSGEEVLTADEEPTYKSSGQAEDQQPGSVTTALPAMGKGMTMQKTDYSEAVVVGVAVLVVAAIVVAIKSLYNRIF